MTCIRSSILCAFIAVVCGATVSCSSTRPEANLYAPNVGPPVPPQKTTAAAIVPRDQVLQVRRVNVAPPFDGPSLLSRKSDGTYAKDYYNQWVAPPEALFATQAVHWLSASGPFASVIDTRSTAPHRYALEISISSLYGDFQDSSEPKVVLNAHAYLIDDASRDRVIAFQKQYDLSVPVARASAQEIVVGSGRAYRQLLESVSRDLTTLHGTVAANEP
jgi:ABC-type uncharacterized transport system auxiliary subunit